MTTNQPKIANEAIPKISARTFLLRIDLNALTRDKIAIKPKITINKFINLDTPFDIRKKCR